MHGLTETIKMNEEAMAIHEAKKMGIVPMGKSLGSCLTVCEKSLLNKAVCGKKTSS